MGKEEVSGLQPVDGPLAHCPNLEVCSVHVALWKCQSSWISLLWPLSLHSVFICFFKSSNPLVLLSSNLQLSVAVLIPKHIKFTQLNCRYWSLPMQGLLPLRSPCVPEDVKPTTENHFPFSTPLFLGTKFHCFSLYSYIYFLFMTFHGILSYPPALAFFLPSFLRC